MFDRFALQMTNVQCARIDDISLNLVGPYAFCAMEVWQDTGRSCVQWHHRE